MLREVETGAGTLRYELTRKAVRRLNLRVGADGRFGDLGFILFLCASRAKCLIDIYFTL